MADKSYEEQFAEIIRENERYEARRYRLRLLLSVAACGGLGTLAGHLADDWTLVLPLALIAPWLAVSIRAQYRGRW